MTDSRTSNTLSSPRSALWRHMHDEHGLTLLVSELDEIERLAKACSADEPETAPCPTCAEACEMLGRAGIPDGDLIDKVGDAIEAMERTSQPPCDDRADLLEAIRKLRHYAATVVAGEYDYWPSRNGREVLAMTQQYECSTATKEVKP